MAEIANMALLASYNRWMNEKLYQAAATLPQQALEQDFPHYGTLRTERSPTQMNLLSNLTAWTVLQNSAAFTALFGA